MKSKSVALISILLLISVIFVSGCVSQEEYCTKADSGESMSLTEAKQIALASECAEQGALKDTYMCNDDTGTWWIDLDIEKEGCNPACVVNVATKQAEINWRCTGIPEINSFDDCVEAGYPIIPPTPGGFPGCRTPDGRIFFDKETDVSLCAKDGEMFSVSVDREEYPDGCCEGLKEWPIPDTRLSIADECYEVGQPSQALYNICIKCGDGVCGQHLVYDENPCNCPEDCAGKDKSHFSSVEEFCNSNDWNLSISQACEETIKDSPICKLC